VSWLVVLREANWLTPARARAYGAILLAFSALAIVVLLASGLVNGGLDPFGKPVGTDFRSFWAASRLSLAGRAADAYQLEAGYRVQQAMFPAASLGRLAFLYPPPFLLVCLPLALAPYLMSLMLWAAATFSLMLGSLSRWLRQPGATLALLAYPAVFTTLAHGHNAFLTTALLATGALSTSRRPWRSGAALGALIIKPHLGPVLPFALLARRQWKAFAAAGLAAGGLCAVSYLVFGPGVWTGFIASGPLARTILEQGLDGNQRLQSAFAGVRLLGGGVALAWIVQGCVAITVIGAMVFTLARTRSDEACGAVMACAAMLASPYLMDYDLMLGAIPLLWLFDQAGRTGFLAYEKSVMTVAFALPLFSRSIAAGLHMPLGPFVLAALMAVCVRRALALDADCVRSRDEEQADPALRAPVSAA
jgi:hypothetical protein